MGIFDKQLGWSPEKKMLRLAEIRKALDKYSEERDGGGTIPRPLLDEAIIYLLDSLKSAMRDLGIEGSALSLFVGVYRPEDPTEFMWMSVIARFENTLDLVKRYEQEGYENLSDKAKSKVYPQLVSRGMI